MIWSGEAKDKAFQNALAVGLSDDDIPLYKGGNGARAYSEAIAIYLAFAVNRVAMTINTLARWNSVGSKLQHCFGRQALPMIWDFADANVFFTSTGSWKAAIEMTINPLELIPTCLQNTIIQHDAQVNHEK